MSLEVIAAPDGVPTTEDGRKHARRSALEQPPPELDLDSMRNIFEHSSCEERSNLCKSNTELAKFCRTVSHQEKCNPNSDQARIMREEFRTIAGEIEQKCRDHNRIPVHGYITHSFVFGEGFGLEIYDPRTFANFLADDENWSLVNRLLTIEGPVRITLKCSSYPYTDTDTYDHERFRKFLGFVSIMKITKITSFDDISLFFKSMNPRVVTNLHISSENSKKMPLEVVKSIETMTNLRELTLRNTLIDNETLDLQKHVHVQYLDLSGNNFEHLCLQEMVNLRSLLLNKNRITKLLLPPKIKGPPYNPERDGRIESWDLSHNLLTELPENFWKIFNVERVRLQHNRLTTLHFDDFPTTSRIREFFVNGNRLTSLSERFIQWVKINTSQGLEYACETIDFRDNDDLSVAGYPPAHNIIADMKTMEALMNDPEKRENYLNLWLYDGDTFLGKFEFSKMGRHSMPFSL